jgi:hypothetical protein
MSFETIFILLSDWCERVVFYLCPSSTPSFYMPYQVFKIQQLYLFLLDLSFYHVSNGPYSPISKYVCTCLIQPYISVRLYLFDTALYLGTSVLVWYSPISKYVCTCLIQPCIYGCLYLFDSPISRYVCTCLIQPYI